MTLIKDPESIKTRFYDCTLPEQVAIYGEALHEQKYELLAVLKHLIRQKDKVVFNKMVTNYTQGKYGK